MKTSIFKSYYGLLEKCATFPFLCKPERLFLILSLFFGILLVFITPPFQIPDEGSHYYRSFAVSEFKFLSDSSQNKIPGYVLPSSLQETVALAAQDVSFHRENKIDVRKNFRLLSRPLEAEKRAFTYCPSAIYSPLVFIPQAFGILLGRLLHLSPLLLMYLGRISNLFVWVIIMFYAIKITPLFKYIFVLLALIPNSLFLAASLSHDALTSGISFLFIAIILSYSFDNIKQLGRMQLLWLFMLSICVSLLRPPYFLLCFLILLIPPEKIGGVKRFLLIFLYIIILSFIFVGGWHLLTNDINAVNPLRQLQVKDLISPGQQMSFIVLHPWKYCHVILNTLRGRWGSYLRTLFGIQSWGLISLPNKLMYLYFGFIIFICMIDNDAQIKISNIRKGIIALVFILTFLSILTLVYLVWTTVGNKVIDGVAGRYFAPISILPLLLLCNSYFKPIRLKLLVYASVFFAILFTHIIMIHALINRYYII